MNDQKSTVRAGWLVPIAALALAFVFTLGLLAGNILPGATRAAGPDPVTATTSRTISVAGTGEVRVKPDMAYLNFQIRTPGASADAALAAYEAAANALTAKLHDLGIAEADMVLNPPATWPNLGDGKVDPSGAGAVASGYISEGAVTVTIRDLNKLRDLAMDGLKASAGIGLSGVQYALQNDQPARTDAMNKAIDNARAQADAVAAKLGLTVKTVAGVTVQPNYAGPFMAGGKGGDMAGASNVSNANLSELGTRPDIVVNLTVQVSYDFE
jgi:uncharacterized protein YggE